MEARRRQQQQQQRRQQNRLSTGPWAARFNRDDIVAVAAALRLAKGVSACCVEDELWLRGEAMNESLDRALRRLAPLVRFTLHAVGGASGVIPNADVSANATATSGAEIELIRVGRLLPERALPDGRWQPLTELIEVARPMAAMPASVPGRVAIRLVRSDRERPAVMLRTSLAAWAKYANAAPMVRLRPLRFAATRDEALIHGAPLPPIGGCRLWEREGIAVPCGMDWSPAVDAVTLRKVLELEEGDVAMFREDGSWELIPGASFAAARRSAVRQTIEGAAP